jgi:hypothetical protein
MALDLTVAKQLRALKTSYDRSVGRRTADAEQHNAYDLSVNTTPRAQTPNGRSYNVVAIDRE